VIKNETDRNLQKINRLLREATDFRERGYYGKAIPIARQILALRKEIEGCSNGVVAESLDYLGELYYLGGKYTDAGPPLETALQIRKDEFGSNHIETAKSYSHLGILSDLMADYAKAEKILKDALKIREVNIGKDHPDVAKTLEKLARLYIHTDNRDKAESLLNKALAIQEKSLGLEHPDLVQTLNTLAWLHIDTEDFEKSEPFTQRALEIGEKAFGSEHPYVADSLNYLGRLYTSRGDNEKSISINKRSLAIREKFLGTDHPDVALSLNNLALPYCGLRKYEEAKSLFIKSLSLREKALGPEHPYLRVVLINIAWVHKTLGDYTGAVPYYKRAMVVFEKTHGPEHTDITSIQRDLAELYNLLGDYENAEPLLKRALDLSKKTLGPYHSRVGTILANLAFVYSSSGEYEKAESFHKQSIEINEKNYDSNPSNLAASLVNLAVMYMDTGKYEKAEELFVRGLDILNKASEPEDLDIANIYNNMGRLYNELNDIKKAENLYNKALVIFKKNLGQEHPVFAICLDNLAILYLNRGIINKAEPLLEQVLEIKEKVYGKDHHAVSTTLNNLAALYGFSKRLIKAAKLYHRVLKIKEETTGVENASYAITLFNLAWLYNATGDFEKAEPLYNQAIEIWKKTFGPEHSNISNGLYHLSKLNTTLGRYEKAYDCINRALAIDNKLIDQVMSFTSEDQKLKFLNANNSNIHHFLNLINNHYSQDPIKIRNALDAWLKFKGVILEVQRRYQDALLSTKDLEAKKLFQELIEVRERLSKLTFAALEENDKKRNIQEKEYLNDEKEKLESKLSRLSQPFALKQKIYAANSGKVSELLSPETALLEFARIETLNLRPDEKENYGEHKRYIVFVLHSGNDDSIAMIDLGDADVIDKTITQYKRDISKSNNAKSDVVTATAQKLYDMVFRPLLNDLGKVKEIFISPDGNLNLIPFEVMQGPDGRYLIEDYTFNYLGAGRDIIGFESKPDDSLKFLFMGDPDFDLALDDKHAVLSGIESKSHDEIHLSHRSVNLNRVTFEPLHYAREELDAICEIMGRDRSEIFTGKQATEEVLMNKHTPEILHLATHGFFLTDQDVSGSGRGWQPADLPGQSENPSKGIEREINIENPLLRSGIFLAGASRSLLTGGTEKSDGIVTAEKILGLNLHGTKMVVLSACDTGLGDVKSGEGVYGLRRAFTQAGAKSLVMSLWKVPDRETKELMVQFYRNIKSGEMNRCQALRQATLEQMKIAKQHHGYADPRYWGAFVFMGEP